MIGTSIVKRIRHVIMIAICFWFSCDKTFAQSNITSYCDSVFLDVEGDIRDPDVLRKDLDIYIRAYKRMQMNMRFETGYNANRFVWDIKCGADLNISEQIYNKIVTLWNKYNKRLSTGRYDIVLQGDIFIVQPKAHPQMYPVGGLYKDSVFLFAKGDLNNPIDAAANAFVFERAQRRMERYMYIKDNQYHWKDISAPELKISDNIFDYITDMRERQNDRLATGKYVIRRLRSNGRYYTLKKDVYHDKNIWY